MALQNNNITSLNPSESLSNMEELDLYNNKISVKPIIPRGLIKLKRLYLQKNQLQDNGDLNELVTSTRHNYTQKEYFTMLDKKGFLQPTLFDRMIASLITAASDLAIYLWRKIKSIFNQIVGWHVYVPIKDLHKNRDIKGLIIGCGYKIDEAKFSSHKDIHPYTNFLTVDHCPEMHPDIACASDELTRNKEFIETFKGKLECVIIEKTDPDVLNPDPTTGRIRILDMAYDLLLDDGICIIDVGGWARNYTSLFAMLSGFKYGTYYPDNIQGAAPLYYHPSIIIKKTSQDISVKKYLINLMRHLFNVDLENEVIIPIKKLDSLKLTYTGHISKQEAPQATKNFIITGFKRPMNLPYYRTRTTKNFTIREVNNIPRSPASSSTNLEIDYYIPNICRPPNNPTALLIKHHNNTIIQ